MSMSELIKLLECFQLSYGDIPVITDGVMEGTRPLEKEQFSVVKPDQDVVLMLSV